MHLYQVYISNFKHITLFALLMQRYFNFSTSHVMEQIRLLALRQAGTILQLVQECKATAQNYNFKKIGV